MTDENTVDNETLRIDRRTILRGIGGTTAVGLVGTPAFTGLASATGSDSGIETCGELDIVCAIDTSGSLNDTEVANLETGVNSFIDALDDSGADIKIGTLEFGTEPGGPGIQGVTGVTNVKPLTSPGPDIDLPDSTNSLAGTPMPAALDIANQLVNDTGAGARSGAEKLVVLFTDGGPNYSPNATYTANGYSAGPFDQGIADSTVSLGEMDQTAGVANGVKSGGVSIVTVYVGDEGEDTQAMSDDAIDAYTDLPTYLEQNIASSSSFAVDVLPANLESVIDDLLAILAELCECEELTLELCAGQDIDVGTVTVTEVDGELTVTYDLNEPWVLCESHVDIGDDLDDLHTNRPGNPQVGRFDLSRTYDPCVSSDTYTVGCDDDALVDVDFETAETLVIAVHGVVRNTGSGDEETAWVCEGQEEASRFVERGNWATYFKYELCEVDAALDCGSEE